MVLAFSRLNKYQEPTLFKERIQAGIMDHSFRAGCNWEVGQRIHFWDNSPMDKKSNPKQFNLFPHTYVQAIELFEMSFVDIDKSNPMYVEGSVNNVEFTLKIGNRKIYKETDLNQVAIRTGFSDFISFFNWYNKSRIRSKVNKYSGQLIHWSKHVKVYDIGTAQIIKS